MGWVTIEALSVAYGDTRVLEDVSLRIPRGSLVAVLGPSGCGKTTLLRAVAGLLPVTSGTITVGGRLVTGPGVQRAPEKRGMGWVPQDASLFPHLTVGENIGFGLPRTRQSDDLYCEPGEAPGGVAGLLAGFTRRGRANRVRPASPQAGSPLAAAARAVSSGQNSAARGVSSGQNAAARAVSSGQNAAAPASSQAALANNSAAPRHNNLAPVPIAPDRSRQSSRADRIAELAALVGLSDLVNRAPSQLSGGQAQRVSLARALAPRPDLMLLDEPFAALDPLLRSALRTEVAALLHAQHNTSLLVTHDQEEALSLADFVAVMRGGEILQFGTPADVYERPVDPWVAGFVGDTVELDGVWQGGRVDCALGALSADWMGGAGAGDGGAASALTDGTPVRVLLRPEWLTLAGSSAPSKTDAVTTAIAYAGHDALVSFTLEGGVVVRARVAAPDLPRVGDRVRLGVRQNALAYPLA